MARALLPEEGPDDASSRSRCLLVRLDNKYVYIYIRLDNNDDATNSSSRSRCLLVLILMY